MKYAEHAQLGKGASEGKGMEVRKRKGDRDKRRGALIHRGSPEKQEPWDAQTWKQLAMKVASCSHAGWEARGLLFPSWRPRGIDDVTHPWPRETDAINLRARRSGNQKLCSHGVGGNGGPRSKERENSPSLHLFAPSRFLVDRWCLSTLVRVNIFYSINWIIC